MPNIAGVLKEEIRRLAKKEIKAQVGHRFRTDGDIPGQYAGQFGRNLRGVEGDDGLPGLRTTNPTTALVCCLGR
jgi:hypothetical protein